MEKEGGGMFDVLLGIGRIRGQKYEKWLEQRLVLVHNDVDFVNKVRKIFGYDKTNITGRGQLTMEDITKEVCSHSEDNQKIIDPNLNCKTQYGGYKKTKKHKRKGRKRKILSRKRAK